MKEKFLKSAGRTSLAFALASIAQTGGANGRIAEIAANCESNLLTIRLMEFPADVKKSGRWHDESSNFTFRSAALGCC